VTDHVVAADNARGAGASSSDRSRPDALNRSRVEDLVADYLRGRANLSILTERAMGEAVHKFVHKDEKDYIKE